MSFRRIAPVAKKDCKPAAKKKAASKAALTPAPKRRPVAHKG